MTNDQSIILKQAVEAHKQGQLQNAEAFYRQILAKNPGHSDANHNLGVIAVQVNKADQALSYLKKALEANPSIRQYWISFIDALIKTDNYDTATQVLAQGKKSGLSGEDIDRFEKYVKDARGANHVKSQADSADAESAFNLAVAAYQKNDFNTALKYFSKVIEIKPDSAAAYNGQGISFKKLDQLDNAQKSYEKALELKPDFAEGYNNLGNVLQHFGKLEQALTNFDKAIELKPNYASAFNNRGNALHKLGSLEQALANFDKAIELKPDYASAFNNRGTVLHKLGSLKQALINFDEAVKLKPDFAEGYNNRGTVLNELEKPEQALTGLEKALELNPDYAEALGNQATVLFDLGKFKEASDSINKALVLKPDFASAHYTLSRLKVYKSGDAQVKEMERIILDPGINEADKASLYFALAKAYEDLGSYDKSFDYLKEANLLRKKKLKFTFNNYEKKIDTIKQAFDSDCFIPDNNFYDNYSPLRPIFIVGMPRSGTTLVEQILASHTKVFGAGELTAMDITVADILQNRHSEQKTGLSVEDFKNIRKNYLNALAGLKADENCITDKLPSNFQHIGFIHTAFPEAKIIHLKRDPRAVCWSIYKGSFKNNNMGYSYDMADIAKYYEIYLDMMSFWKKRFKDIVYDICYEDLTENQEKETQKLIEFCGLEWEDNCLDFHKTKREVRTASAVQVRKKMYKGSSQAWRKYETHLQPLWEAYGIISFNKASAIQPALDLLETGKYGQALSWLEQWILNNGEDALALSYIATIHHNTGNIEKAACSLQEALKLDPENIEYLNRLYHLLGLTGKFEETLTVCNKIIELQPDSEAGYYHRANSYLQIHRLDEAANDYDKAIELKPTFTEAYTNRGTVYANMGLWEKAVENYDMAMLLSPEYPNVYLNLSILFKNRGLFEDVLKALYCGLGWIPENILLKQQLINELNYFQPDNDHHVFVKAQKQLKCIRPDHTSSVKIEDKTIYALVKKLQAVLASLDLNIDHYNETQIWRGVNNGDDCTDFSKVFNAYGIIPEHCFGCYKVLVEPRNIMELLKLFVLFDELSLPNNNPRKVLVEVREGISGRYKGLIYTRDLNEGKKIIKQVQSLVDEKISRGIPVSMKRGCSEFALTYPEYSKVPDREEDLVPYNEEWRKFEKHTGKKAPASVAHFIHTPHDHKGFTLKDALVMFNWLKYADKIKDYNYKGILAEG